MNPIIELAHVLADGGASNAGVALSAHVVSQGHDDLLDLLGQLAGWGEDQSLAIPQFGVNLKLEFEHYKLCKGSVALKCILIFGNTSAQVIF